MGTRRSLFITHCQFSQVQTQITLWTCGSFWNLLKCYATVFKGDESMWEADTVYNGTTTNNIQLMLHVQYIQLLHCILL